MKTITIAALWLTTLAGASSAAQMSDLFADRPQISGTTQTLEADTKMADEEAFEPYHYRSGDTSVWAAWTAPTHGWVTIDTGGSVIDTFVAVYRGDDFASMLPIARAKNFRSNPATVRFPVEPGTTYQIAVGSTNYRGLVRLNIQLTPEPIPAGIPGADRFAERQTLNGLQAYGVANNAKAGTDPYQPRQTSSRGQDVWWQWTAPATGWVTIDTLESVAANLESPIDTELTVYSGAPVNPPGWEDLTLVARHDDVPNSRLSSVSFQTEAGRTYQIAVASGSSRTVVGNIILKLSLAPNNLPAGIPGTDAFARRPLLRGLPSSGVACSSFAAMDIDEDKGPGAIGATVWWSWTATESGPVVIDTEGSSVDTVLTVYQGADISSLKLVAWNNNVDGAAWSRLILPAEAGATYQIQVDRRGQNFTFVTIANLVLNLDRAPVPNIEVRQPLPVVLNDNQSRRAFGKVTVGRSSKAMTFTIRNTGNAMLSGISAMTTGPQARDFKVRQPLRTSLAPGEQTRITVTFRPRKPGSSSCSLVIGSTDPDENPFAILLSGRGLKSRP